jgi:chorismate mutase
LYFEFLDITRGQAGFTSAQTLAAARRYGLRLPFRCQAAACRLEVTVAVAADTARRSGLGDGVTAVAVAKASRDSRGRLTLRIKFSERERRLLARLTRERSSSPLGSSPAARLGR